LADSGACDPPPSLTSTFGHEGMNVAFHRTVWVMGVTASWLLCGIVPSVAQVATNGPAAFGAFGSSMYGGDIERRLMLIQGYLGLQDYGFRYEIPIDGRLVVSVGVKTNGQVNRQASRTYQIALPPGDYATQRVFVHDKPDGFLSLTRWPAPGFANHDVDVKWSVMLSRFAGYEFTVPKEVFEGPGFQSMNQRPYGPLELGKNEAVFAYDLIGSDQKTERFSLHITVRWEKRRLDDEPGVVLMPDEDTGKPNPQGGANWRQPSRDRKSVV
jgi:hypothetical protein